MQIKHLSRQHLTATIKVKNYSHYECKTIHITLTCITDTYNALRRDNLRIGFVYSQVFMVVFLYNSIIFVMKVARLWKFLNFA